jgi:hypothetical protein
MYHAQVCGIYKTLNMYHAQVCGIYKTLNMYHAQVCGIYSIGLNNTFSLYQGNPNRNHKLLKVATYKWKVHNGKTEIISFVIKFQYIL